MTIHDATNPPAPVTHTLSFPIFHRPLSVTYLSVSLKCLGFVQCEEGEVRKMGRTLPQLKMSTACQHETSAVVNGNAHATSSTWSAQERRSFPAVSRSTDDGHTTDTQRTGASSRTDSEHFLDAWRRDTTEDQEKETPRHGSTHVPPPFSWRSIHLGHDDGVPPLR